MKKIYQKYKDWFVMGLLALLCFKSCQSCSRSRTIEFNNKKHIEVVDSLKKDIIVLDGQLTDIKNDTTLYLSKINSLESTIEMYKEENRGLKDDNKHYRNTNRVLVNTNNQIINKDKE
jgi:hypothetical protein